jgi:tRNA (guanine-N7-)-methyltransferase
MRARAHYNPFNIRPEISEKPDFEQIFGNSNPICLEVGFSNGRWLIPFAKANPNINVVGLETRRKFVAKVKDDIENIKNAYALLANANTTVKELFKPDTLSSVVILFPDPWYKKKHFKRRLVNEEFLDNLRSLLKKDGMIHIASDQKIFCEEMREVLTEHKGFENLYPENDFAPENIPGFESDIEVYHLNNNNPIYRLQFKKS